MGSRDDRLKKKEDSGLSESHISTFWHATGLRRKRKSVRVRITRRIFLEEVGLELALEGLTEGEGYARQGNSMSKGREVRITGG